MSDPHPRRSAETAPTATVPTPREMALALTCAALWALAFFLYVVFRSGLELDASDFDKFLLAAGQFHTGDLGPIYEWQEDRGPFRYAPFTLPLFEPFALLSPSHAKLWWFAMQYGCLIAGAALLYRSLKSVHPQAIWICLLSIALTSRYWVDAIFSGQTTGWIFLGASAGLAALLHGNPLRGGVWLAIPTALKVAPGIFYFPFLFESRRVLTRLIAGSALLVALSTALFTLQVGPADSAKLFRAWGATVLADSEYVKTTHINNQSLKGLLSRSAQRDDAEGDSGVRAARAWTPEGADAVWKVCVLVLVGAFLLAGFLRTPRTPVGKLAWFALAVCLFQLLNPTTYGYNGPVLAFAVAGVLAARPEWSPSAALGKDRLVSAALLAVAVVFALSGGEKPHLNLGDRIVERLALPLAATLFLAGWLAVICWRGSPPRFSARDGERG